MSIATRINAIEEHLENAYEKLDDLGVDLTDVDKNIDNIATKLEEVYDEYPKIPEVTDVTEANINDTKKARMEIDLKGNTAQESTTGANMINTSNRGTFTTNGIKFTYLGDGQYDINGTSTAGLDGYIADNLNVVLEQNTTYTMYYEVLSGTASNLGLMNFAVNGTKNGTTTANMHYMGVDNIVSKGIKKATFSTSTNDEVIKKVNIYIGGANRVFNHLKIRVMIYKGTEDISWEKYTRRNIKS